MRCATTDTGRREGFVLVYCTPSRLSFARTEKFYKQIQRVKDRQGRDRPLYPGPC